VQVRGTFSAPGPWRPAVGSGLAQTLGVARYPLHVSAHCRTRALDLASIGEHTARWQGGGTTLPERDRSSLHSSAVASTLFRTLLMCKTFRRAWHREAFRKTISSVSATTAASNQWQRTGVRQPSILRSHKVKQLHGCIFRQRNPDWIWRELWSSGQRGTTCTSEMAPARTSRSLRSKSMRFGHTATPNPSLKRSANGRPPSPVWRYAVHFRQPGLGVLPSSPA
jgi:hypothetical protein